MNEVLTIESLMAAVAAMRVHGARNLVAIELSLDMLDYFRSLPTHPVNSTLTRVYGLPIRIADGELVARPVYA